MFEYRIDGRYLYLTCGKVSEFCYLGDRGILKGEVRPEDLNRVKIAFSTIDGSQYTFYVPVDSTTIEETLDKGNAMISELSAHLDPK